MRAFYEEHRRGTVPTMAGMVNSAFGGWSLRLRWAFALVAVVPVWSLGAQRPAAFFDGVDEASRPVMEKARQRIDDDRKGDFSIRFVDGEGKPISGRAEIHLVKHDFAFGANLRGIWALPQTDPARDAGLRVIEELFDTVTVGNFWRSMEPKRGGQLSWGDVDDEVEWAKTRGLAMRFHCLIYDYSYAAPKWGQEIKTTDDWWPLIESRIRAVAERYGESVGEYDVINEMLLNEPWAKENNPTHPLLWDPAVGARVMKLARQYLPDATLVSLEAGQATVADTNTYAKRVYEYQKRLIELGAPVDAIGHQAHFFNARGRRFQDGSPQAGPDAFTMRAIEAGLDRLATLGKPMRITEFSAPSRSAKDEDPRQRLSDEEIAAWEVNYYTLVFSKPYVGELTRWFVVDGVGGRAIDAGLLTEQGVKKPSYEAIRKLLKEQWSTQWTGNLADGRASFRGFYGTYDVRIPGHARVRLNLPRGGPAEQVVKVVVGP